MAVKGIKALVSTLTKVGFSLKVTVGVHLIQAKFTYSRTFSQVYQPIINSCFFVSKNS